MLVGCGMQHDLNFVIQHNSCELNFVFYITKNGHKFNGARITLLTIPRSLELTMYLKQGKFTVIQKHQFLDPVKETLPRELRTNRAARS